MTWEEFIRWVMIPAIGVSALVAIILTLREEIRDWRNGQW